MYLQNISNPTIVNWNDILHSMLYYDIHDVWIHAMESWLPWNTSIFVLSRPPMNEVWIIVTVNLYLFVFSSLISTTFPLWYFRKNVRATYQFNAAIIMALSFLQWTPDARGCSLSVWVQFNLFSSYCISSLTIQVLWKFDRYVSLLNDESYSNMYTKRAISIPIRVE